MEALSVCPADRFDLRLIQFANELDRCGRCAAQQTTVSTPSGSDRPQTVVMQVFTLLKEVRRQQHERVAWHPELPDERLVHLSRHPAHWLLLTQQSSEGSGDVTGRV